MDRLAVFDLTTEVEMCTSVEQNRDTEVTRLFVKGIHQFPIGIYVYKMRDDLETFQPHVPNGIFEFNYGLISLVGINARKSDQPVRILFHHLCDKNVGDFESKRCFRIHGYNNRFVHSCGIHVFNGVQFHSLAAEELAVTLEHLRQVIRNTLDVSLNSFPCVQLRVRVDNQDRSPPGFSF